MPRIPWRAQPSMICASFHCFLTVAVLSESLAESATLGPVPRQGFALDLDAEAGRVGQFEPAVVLP